MSPASRGGLGAQPPQLLHSPSPPLQALPFPQPRGLETQQGHCQNLPLACASPDLGVRAGQCSQPGEHSGHAKSSQRGEHSGHAKSSQRGEHSGHARPWHDPQSVLGSLWPDHSLPVVSNRSLESDWGFPGPASLWPSSSQPLPVLDVTPSLSWALRQKSLSLSGPGTEAQDL
ncbi:hypothetical protein P7K49_035266 [Saguinus oedipus]|uniref:Uncharacterized protein n=1 Tax=Saguinus oedipus TaxID=9490 RepID=A0ABQ9TM65_SAGOE|nr:hypothetical protein P7K49_035266 [Saguinus oedipus]